MLFSRMESPHLQILENYKTMNAKGDIASGKDNPNTLNRRDLRIGLRHRDSLAVYKSSMPISPINRDFLGDGTNVDSRQNQKLKPSSSSSDLDDNPTLSTQDPSSSSTDSSTPQETAKTHNPVVDAVSESPEGDDDGSSQDSTDDDTGSIDSAYSSDEEYSEKPTLDTSDTVANGVKGTEEGADSMKHEDESESALKKKKKKKNKLKSMAKGMGSFLGLRKSKKKRLQEEFQRMVQDATEFNTAVNAGLPPETLPASPALRSIPDGNVYNSPLATATASIERVPPLSETLPPTDGPESPRANIGRLFLRKSKSEILRPNEDLTKPPYLQTRSHTQEHIVTQSPLRPYVPPRDTSGSFLPSHHFSVPIKGIMKVRTTGPVGSNAGGQRHKRSNTLATDPSHKKETENPQNTFRNRSVSNLFLYRPYSMSAVLDDEAQMNCIAAEAAEAMSGMRDDGNGTGEAEPTKTQRRGISFADQHGHMLKTTRFCDNLHYSEGSVHEDWDEDEWDEPKGCTIM